MNHLTKEQPHRIHILLFVLVGLLVWGNSLFNDFFISDDEDQILHHPLVRSISNIPTFFLGSSYYVSSNDSLYGPYYRPLQQVFYTLLWSVHGPDPLVFHLLHIVLHIANSILLYFFASYFMPLWYAFFVGSFFLVHPITSEVVLHSANLQDLLYFFFGMIGLFIIRRQLLSTRYLLLFSSMLLLALLSKESAIYFAALYVVYTVLYKKNQQMLTLTTICVVIVGYLFVRFFVARLPFTTPGSIALIAHMPLGQRLLSVPMILLLYSKTLFLPFELSSAHYWAMSTITLNTVVLPAIGVGICLICVGYVYRYIGKHLNYRVGLLFLSWFAIGLTLQLHIIPLDVTYAERWFYFSTAGLLSFIFLGIYAYRKYNKGRYMTIWLGIIVMIIFAGRSIARTGDWRDSYTLLQKDLKVSSDNYYLENLLATLYIRDRRYAEAKPLIATSLIVHPFVGNLTNRAIIAVYEHDYKTAEDYYTKALVISPLYQAYINYVNFLYYILHDGGRAAVFAQNTLVQYPKSGELWAILAQWFYQQNKPQEAYEAATKAYLYMPIPLTKEILEAIKQKRPMQIEKYLAI